MDILDTKKRFLAELLAKVTGDRNSDLQQRHAPKPKAEGDFGYVAPKRVPGEEPPSLITGKGVTGLAPRMDLISVPAEPGGMATINKPRDSDIELLADLIPSKIQVNGKPSTPGTRLWSDQNDPEFADRQMNEKIDRDERERTEEGD